MPIPERYAESACPGVGLVGLAPQAGGESGGGAAVPEVITVPERYCSIMVRRAASGSVVCSSTSADV